MVLWKRGRARLELGRLEEAIEDSQAALRREALQPLEKADCWMVTAHAKHRGAAQRRGVGLEHRRAHMAHGGHVMGNVERCWARICC